MLPDLRFEATRESAMGRGEVVWRATTLLFGQGGEVVTRGSPPIYDPLGV